MSIEMTEIPLIMNPMAGKGGGAAVSAEIRAFFAAQGVALRIYPTEAPRHAAVLAETLVRDGARTVLSLGGDGTAFEVINGLFRSGLAERVRLGILPFGTGNSFLRDFGMTCWQEVAQCVIEQKCRRVDIGQVKYTHQGQEETVWFHNVVGLGMMAKGCALRHSRFRFLGPYAYHAAFFAMLPAIPTQTLRLTSAGETRVLQTPLLAVCNSQYTGRDMRISPRSNVMDGQLELLYCEPVSIGQWLRLFATLPQGGHLDHPAVHTLCANELQITNDNSDLLMLDGEVHHGNTLRIVLLPQALTVFAG